MPKRSMDAERESFLAIAKQAAAAASRDPEVMTEAADFAVAELERLRESVSSDSTARKQWVRVVARNHARRVGAKLHREKPMGRAGSEPPRMPDVYTDEHVERLIAEMRKGNQQSLGSVVALKVDFDKSWGLLGGEARALLHEKYVEGYTSKEIAKARGLTPGTIDNKLSEAKAAARPLFAELFAVLQGDDIEEER